MISYKSYIKREILNQATQKELEDVKDENAFTEVTPKNIGKLDMVIAFDITDHRYI